MNNKDRDIQLDQYRGSLMLYIVCFVHVLYWLNLGKEPWLSIILIEMPLIFFISGASLSFHKAPRSFTQTCMNRIKRIVLPYYIYAAWMLVALLLLSLLGYVAQTYGISLIRVQGNYDVSAISIKDLVKIMLAYDIPQMPYMWHLWFILPYLFLSCTFDFQKVVLQKVNRWLYIAILVIVFLTVQSFVHNQLVRNVFAYNIFMVIGYCFYKKLPIQDIAYCMIASFVVFLLYAFVFLGGHVCPMQNHKFPPDLLFVSYNVFVLCLVAILFSRIKLPNCKLLRFWNREGFSLYLYQNISFMILAWMCGSLHIGLLPWIVQMIVCMFSACLISMAFCCLVQKINQCIFDRFLV